MEKHPINLSDTTSGDDSSVLRHVAEKSKLNFLAISQQVSLSFLHFLHLIKNHDLDKVVKEQEKKKQQDNIAIPSTLLVEITGSEFLKTRKTSNLLSGVFLIGILLGCAISVFTILALLKSDIEITGSLLAYMGLGFLIALLLIIGIPMVLAGMEPFLKRVQEKHHDFMERFLNLFQ